MKLFVHKLLSTIWPAAIWSALIFLLLVIPGNGFPSASLFGITHLDKAVHAYLFFVFTWLWAKRISTTALHPTYKKQLITIAFLATFYGIVMEFVQLYVGRDFDVWDMVADGAGAFLCAAILLKKIGPGKNRGRNQN
jgi:VanZ family protein